MIGSLYAGITGLSANSTAMSIIGDNIANVNTTAFKSNRASFANILSQSLGGSSGNEIGRGVQFTGQNALWTQGTLENTSSPTDFAINGRGFFVMRDENGNDYYSRAGSFKFDKNGSLVDPNGYVVQGYEVDNSGNLGPVGDITVPTGSTPPAATDQIAITLNLDADAVAPAAASMTIDSANALSDVTYTAANAGIAGNTISVSYADPGAASQPLAVSVSGNDITVSLATDGTGAITSTAAQVAAAVNGDPAASALVSAAPEGAGTGVVQAAAASTLDGGLDAESYSSTITAYDSLGSPVPLTINFTRQGMGTWNWEASVPSSVGTTTSSGTIGFDADGVLDPALSGGSNPTIQVTGLASGAADLSMSWEYLSNSASNGTITGYASPSVTTFSSQTGYPAGTLQSTQIDESGVVTGVYTNGQLTPLFQIVLSDFQNYDGLSAIGNNLYTESLSSGEALLGTPGNGRLGGITPNALEMSNVDLATEFVKMITTQRAFQANSRVITTSDEILNELINLKR